MSTLNKQNCMRAQVACSKGTEWMVSSYNEWQQRSPLPDVPERNSSSLIQLLSRVAHKQQQLNSAIAHSIRPMILILGILLSAKWR